MLGLPRFYLPDLSSLTKPDERLVPRKSNSYDRYSRPNRGHYHRPIYRGRDDYRYNNSGHGPPATFSQVAASTY